MELENTPNEPQPQGGQSQSPANGPNGQNGLGGGAGRRRRRRRGKKPGTGAPGAQAQPAQPQPGQQQGRSNGQQHHRQGRNHQSNGGGGQNSGGRKAGGGGGGMRRQRRGGGTPFVGPMDHSYRGGGTIGNTADRQSGGRFRQNGRNLEQQPHYIDPDMVPVGNIREDAPTRIFCFIEDLFFFAKINEISRKLGIKVEFVKTVEPILERAGDEIPEDDRPALVIFDLNNVNVKPMAAITKLRTKFKKAISIVGFLQHIQGDLKMKAVEAGCDMVVPRSAFSQNLPNLLRRHAEIEVEDTPQPGL